MTSCWGQRTLPQWAELMTQRRHKHYVTMASTWCHHADISTMTSAAWYYVCAFERARMYMCLSVTLFCPFLKRSTNALRACLHVHMSAYVACFFSDVRLKFLFFREVKRFCFEDAYECVRVCVCAICVCVCAYVCVCVCACRASTYVCGLVCYPFLPFSEAKY